MLNREEIIARFEQLIEMGNAISASSVTRTGSLGWRSPFSYDQVDTLKASEWRMSSLSILENVYGKISHFYIEFDSNSDALESLAGKRQLVRCLGILNSAKNEYAIDLNSHQAPQNANTENFLETLDVRKGIDLEAKRNARVYLILLSIIFLSVCIGAFFLFGWVATTIISLSLPFAGYVLSVIFLRDWSPSKIHERVLEWEQARLYKRLGV